VRILYRQPIEGVVYHAGDESVILEVRRGLEVADTLAAKCGPESDLGNLIDRCVLLGYEWGVTATEAAT
jgi:hypothetical protein